MTTRAPDSPRSSPARDMVDAAVEEADKSIAYFDAKMRARMAALAAHLRGEEPDEEPITTTRPLPMLPQEPQHR